MRVAVAVAVIQVAQVVQVAVVMVGRLAPQMQELQTRVVVEAAVNQVAALVLMVVLGLLFFQSRLQITQALQQVHPQSQPLVATPF
jgi:hypothetical protein